MKEIFKDIPNYEGQYQVSNLGRVKSMARLDPLGKKIRSRILKPCIYSSGYLKVALSKVGLPKTYKVSVLVAITFLNHKPNGHTIEVSHRDFNKSNDRLDNLQLLTNIKHKYYDRNQSKCSSKYVGVSWRKDRNKWRAMLWIDNRHKHIGHFNTEIDAYNARQTALNQIKV